MRTFFFKLLISFHRDDKVNEQHFPRTVTPLIINVNISPQTMKAIRISATWKKVTE